MIDATTQTTIFVTMLLAKCPILWRSLVNMMSGITAKLSCMERITWLSNKSLAIPFSPYITVIIKAGMIAMALVISLLSHGLVSFHHIINKKKVTKLSLIPRTPTITAGRYFLHRKSNQSDYCARNWKPMREKTGEITSSRWARRKFLDNTSLIVRLFSSKYF